MFTRLRTTARMFVAGCAVATGMIAGDISAGVVPAEKAAVRDLRLAASVQLTFHQAKKRFGTIAELKSGGFLDPQWPRAPGSLYQVSCQLEKGDGGFVCHADARAPAIRHFRVDAMQSVRVQSGARATAASPVYRTAKTK